MTSALAPFAATTATRASSVMRPLPVGGRRHRTAAEAICPAMDDLPARAELIAGRWPRGHGPTAAAEAVVLESTARLLGLAPGSRVRLGAELRPRARAGRST